MNLQRVRMVWENHYSQSSVKSLKFGRIRHPSSSLGNMGCQSLVFLGGLVLHVCTSLFVSMVLMFVCIVCCHSTCKMGSHIREGVEALIYIVGPIA